jgi:pimeloyl-ACP methyl ester carboxylesterase
MHWRDTLTIRHEGRTTLVRRLGPDSGPQFVLVHGIGVAATYFERLAEVLARTGGVHVVELPGFGPGPRPVEPLTVEEHAAQVVHYLRSSGLQRVVLVGHSMGSQFVVEAALKAPELVSSVVVMGCVVDPDARSATRQGLRLLADFLREPPKANLMVLRDYARTGPRWYLASLPAMLGYRLEEAVSALPHPLLVVRGGRDPIAPRAWTEQVCRSAPDARMLEIPGAGHVVMWSHAEEVGTAVVDHAHAAADGRSA